MDDKFKVQIISPEKIVFSGDSTIAVLPAYEGELGILKQHIPIITFLRPGIINIKNSDDSNLNFFVEDGIAEFNNNNLSILSTLAVNTKDMSKGYLENLNDSALEKLKNNNLTDEEKYLINHKLDTIRNLNI